MAKYRLIIEWDDFTQVRLGAPPEVPKNCESAGPPIADHAL